MIYKIKSSGNKLSENEISQVEKALNCHFDPQYRNFIFQFNGGHPEPAGFKIQNLTASPDESSVHYFYGIGASSAHTDIASAANIFRGRLPHQLIPIADDPFGNQICIVISGSDVGAVFFWDHETEHTPPTFKNTVKLADCFNDFLASLQVLSRNWESATEKAMREDDVIAIKHIAEASNNLDGVDAFGRTLIENAAIANAVKILEYLHSQGSSLGNALSLAKENARFFPEHDRAVQIISRLMRKN